MLGKVEGRRRRGQQDEMAGWHHWLDGHEFEWTLGWKGRPGVLQSMGSQRVRHDWATQLNWTEAVCIAKNLVLCVISGIEGYWNIWSLVRGNYSNRMQLLCSSNGEESACDAGDQDSIPGLGSFSGEGNGNSLQYSCLEDSMDRETWQAIVHGVAKSQTWLSDQHT